MFDSVVKDISDRVGRILGHVIVDTLPGSPAQDGTEITGASMPSGGVGIRGWLSAIYTKLAASIAVTVATLPLPTGAAQDSTLTGGTQKTQIVSSGGNAQAVDSSGRASTTVAADTAHSMGSGVMDTGTQRVVLASDGPTVTALGNTTDSAVTGDTSGSINGHLRGITKQMAVQLPAALGQTTKSASLPVTWASDQTLGQATATLQNAVSATGNGTAMDVSGMGTVAFQITGSFTATLTPEVSIDGVTWTTLLCQQPNGHTLFGSSMNSAGLWRGSVTGYNWFRVRAVWTSGTSVTVVAHATTEVLNSIGAMGLFTSSGLAIGSGNYGNADTLGAGSTVLQVAPYNLGYTGSAWDRLRVTTTLKTAQSTSTASGSDLTVWTPTSGKKFRLRTLRARASVAGRYEVRDATGTVIDYCYLEANKWTEVEKLEANGYLSAAANNALLLRNQSGSAADLDATASGNEE